MTHYLDHAATTPLAPDVLEAWLRCVRDLAAHPGNPSSLHAGGRRARRELEDARARIACVLGAERSEVVFTSGATEADALAVGGGARGVRDRDPQRHLVALSGAEHDAVLEQAAVLTRDGFTVHTLPLDRNGATTCRMLREPESCTPSPPTPDVQTQTWQASLALVSVGLVSSELGTIQPVADWVDSLRRFSPHTLIHTDAAQALPTVPLDFHALDVDMLTIGGHKIGAPVGTGMLLVKKGTPLLTDRPGGGHERGIRSGTPDVAGAVALATALENAVHDRTRRLAHAQYLREYLLAALHGVCEGEVKPSIDPALSAPTIIHLSLPTAHPEALLMSMDAAGVHVSAGSACHAGVTRPSAVLLRAGRNDRQARGVLRVSTAASTTTEDIDAFVAALPAALTAARALDTLEDEAPTAEVSGASHTRETRGERQ